MDGQILKLNYSEILGERLSEKQKKLYKGWDGNVRAYKEMGAKLYCNGEEKKQVSISFDDAPDSYCTPRILDILKSLGVQAGFSVIGMHLEENPGLVKRIFREKHTIVNHTYSHRDMAEASPEEIRKEIGKTEKMIEKLIGVKPALVRPPFGELSMDAVKRINDMDYQILLWSYDVCDWLAEKREDILKGMLERIRPGEIILLHSYENKEPTVEALETMIKGLRERGFEIVPPDRLLGISPYFA